MDVEPVDEFDLPLDPNNGNQNNNNQNKLGVVPFAVLIFYSVSGGAFGVEEAVRSAGNFYTLVGFLIFPLVWSLQEVLVTTELACAFPEASGGVIWVEQALGQGAGWMCGYLHWVSGATDNAIYPVLFLDYLLHLMVTDDPEEGGPGDNESSPNSQRHSLFLLLTKFLLLSGISCLLAYLNWLGLPLVGKMSMTICLVALSPFVLMTLIGAFQVDPSQWFEPPQQSPQPEITDDTTNSNESNNAPTVPLFSMAALGSIAWRPFLNNLFWNLNSFGKTNKK